MWKNNMKKLGYVLIFMIIMFSVASCSKNNDNNDNFTSNDAYNGVQYETISLTMDNYNKYIAIYQQKVTSSMSKDEVVYFNFYGADGCRFDDCIITYNLKSTTTYTLKLTISGDGQVLSYGADNSKLVITAISGTVKVPIIN